MQGDITVRSSAGAGSTFSLWLPSPGEPEPGRSARGAQPSDAGRHRGLADIGEGMLRELESVLEAFVRRVRAECPVPGAGTLKFSQLTDHIPSYVADLAGMLIALDESGGNPSSVLADATDIHRLVAGRHGAQRARLGWDEAAIRCEYVILREEIERTIRHRARDVDTATIDEAWAVMTRFIEEAERASLGALARASR
jgi:hypothetical protein